VSAPRWTQALLRCLAPEQRQDEILGDLEEAHGRRTLDRGPAAAALRPSLEDMDLARAVLRERVNPGVSSLDEGNGVESRAKRLHQDIPASR